MDKKIGLVLAGGGSKGAYQIGAIKALKSLKIDFDVVTGTSIGALNGCMVAQGDYEKLYNLWEHITIQDVLNGIDQLDFKFDEIVNNRNMLVSFFKKYFQESGADIEPFKKMITSLFDNDKLQNSKVEFGAVTVSYPQLKPVIINKEMMNDEGINYLIATASCFPAFPIHRFSDNAYIDGGYYDNLPIELALSYGANNLIVIDLNDNVTHSNFLNREFIKYIYPRFNLGIFLDFNREILDRNIKYGFNDVYKIFNIYSGYKYTFYKFEQPDFFNEFYLFLLKMEPELAKNINFKDDMYITKYFLNKQHKVVLSVNDLNYGVIDEILEILNYNGEDVYDFYNTTADIMNTFEEAFNENYEIIPKLYLSNIKDFVNDLDRVGRITKIINQIIYPKKRIVSDELIYFFNPVDIVLAHWIIMLRNEISFKNKI